MRNTFTVAALLVALSSTTSFAETACRAEGEFNIHSFPIEFSLTFPDGPSAGFNDSETFDKTGDQLGSGYGFYEGTDLVFDGRPISKGGYAYGTYPSWEGSTVTAWAKIEISTDWTPDVSEYCSKHKTRWTGDRVCVEKKTQDLPTSFVVDIATDVGQRVHASKTFTNINHATHWTIITPRLICLGPINQFEARILDLTGGEVNFRVHKISYFAGINY